MRGCDEALRQKKAFKGKIFITTGIIFTLVEVIWTFYKNKNVYLHEISYSIGVTEHGYLSFRLTGMKQKTCKALFKQKSLVYQYILLFQITCIVLALWMARTVRKERRKLQANLQAHFES